MKKITTRAKTRDAAFQFRMGTGFPGDVNRTHPASIEPNQNNATNPLDFFGNAVVVDSATNTVRKILTTDTGITTIYGIGVRPYPTQQTSGGSSASFGVGAPNPQQPIDILRSGYFFTKLNGATASAKDGTVYLRVAASTTGHVLGGFEAAADGANTVTLTNVVFNGPAGADGVVECFIRPR